jgi:hypothetical protein
VLLSILQIEIWLTARVEPHEMVSVSVRRPLRILDHF